VNDAELRVDKGGQHCCALLGTD